MMKQMLIAIADGYEESSTTAELESTTYHNSNRSLNCVRNSLTNEIAERIASRDVFFSLEFLPPRTQLGVQNLLERFNLIEDGGPLFCSVTWHTGDNPGSKKETSSISFASSMAKSYNFDTMLHLAACNLTRDQVMSYLQAAYLDGIRSVLALRGDASPGWTCPNNGFPHAVDLIRFIRENFGDLFTIGVAGYPSGHHEANSYEEDLIHLKEKVDAGADFIVSQIFFTAETFKKFHRDCKILGISVPVIPGILPILSFSSVWRIARICQLEIPPEILKSLLSIAHNDQAVTNFGIHFATNLARELLISDGVPGIHFFTLNREQPTIEVCQQLGLWIRVPRTLPLALRTCIRFEQLKAYLNAYKRQKTARKICT